MEELAKFDPNVRPNNVLLFTVLNADYPIDVSIIYKVCSPVGKVDRIVIFRRGYVIHAMVEFNNIDSADQAKRNLHGCDVYSVADSPFVGPCESLAKTPSNSKLCHHQAGG